MRLPRIVTSALLLAALLVLASAATGGPDTALAFTEGETEDAETETTGITPEEGGEDVIVPAVEVPAEEEEVTDAPWTQRFLAPTALALGVIGVVGVVAYYGLRIGSKYRVVD